MSEGQHPGVFTKRNNDGNKWKYTKCIKVRDNTFLPHVSTKQTSLLIFESC